MYLIWSEIWFELIFKTFYIMIYLKFLYYYWNCIIRYRINLKLFQFCVNCFNFVGPRKLMESKPSYQIYQSKHKLICGLNELSHVFKSTILNLLGWWIYVGCFDLKTWLKRECIWLRRMLCSIRSLSKKFMVNRTILIFLNCTYTYN